MDNLLNLKEEFQYSLPNTVYVIISNDEAAATRGWKRMIAESILNIYILEGGINNWISIFGKDDPRLVACQGDEDQLRYVVTAAFGANYPAAEPGIHEVELQFTPKVKLDFNRGATKGGCG